MEKHKYNTVKNLGKVKFSCILGNPPYGSGRSEIHLQIFKTSLDYCTDSLCFIMPSKPIFEQLKQKWFDIFKNAVCTNIQVVSKSMFPNTTMENTAIYYCDRTIPIEQAEDKYDRQLDVDDKIYNIISDKGHKLFIDKMNEVCKDNTLKIKFAFMGKENYPSDYADLQNGVKNDKYYLNISRAGIKPGDGAQIWFSGLLEKESIKTAQEELEFCKTHKAAKSIIECPSIEYGENLRNLMINGKVLRYSLWLTQKSQNITNPQYKYVPDIKYDEIYNDRQLLLACKISEKDINIILDYLKDFNFERNRNEEVRNYVENGSSKPDSSSSGSEESKPIVDD